MKLVSCHIENFGKLSNLSINFSDGINVINESNAWGKSTLAAFMKAMFYGFDNKKGIGAFEKERVLYRPWQGGVFGGELDFEMNGRTYRISRSFGRTEKSDEFHLYDLSTNLEIYEYSQNIGIEIFDLDSHSFRKSIYIAQNDCSSETSDYINAKLGNQTQKNDDIDNFEKANQHLKEILNQLTPDRATGNIKRRRNYITQLQQELRTFESAQDGMDSIKRKEKLVSVQIDELMAIRQNYGAALVVASEDSRRKELYAQYDAMCKEVDEKEQKFESLKALFPNGVPAREEFKEQLQFIRNIENKKTKIKGLELNQQECDRWNRLQEMFEIEVPEVSKIETSLDTLASADKQKETLAGLEMRMQMAQKEASVSVEEPVFEKISHKIPLGIGAGMTIASLVAFGFWYVGMIPQAYRTSVLLSILFAAVIGVILLVTGIVLGNKAKKEKAQWTKTTQEEKDRLESQYQMLRSQVNTLKDSINQIHSTVGTFLGRFRIYCKVEEYSAKLYELKSMIAEYERLKEKFQSGAEEQTTLDAENQKVVDFAKKYGFDLKDDYSLALSGYQDKAMEYHMAHSAYVEASSKRESFEKRQDKSFWTKEALCPYSIDELNQMIQQADVQIEELKNAKIQYEKQIDDLQEQLDLRDEKQEELEYQQELQELDTAKYNLVKLTQEYLQKAKELFIARYMAPIANAFSKYYQLLTGDDSGTWMIDANIELKMKELGEYRDTRWLSAGYQDLLGVCMRLALVDTMYQEEKPFLILDDPFVNMDKEKVSAGNQLLLEVAKEYQVIYFTCHDSRSPFGDK